MNELSRQINHPCRQRSSSLCTHTYISNRKYRNKKNERDAITSHASNQMYLCMYEYMLRLLSIFNRHAIEQFIYIQKKNQMCAIQSITKRNMLAVSYRKRKQQFKHFTDKRSFSCFSFYRTLKSVKTISIKIKTVFFPRKLF